MFSLLLCASLWQFDAPVPAGEPVKEFAITHQEASPALRDRVADQLGHTRHQTHLQGACPPLCWRITADADAQ